MKARFLGFKIDYKSIKNKTKLDDLMLSIASSPTLKNDPKRKIYLDTSDKTYYRGMVVTIKDQKKFCRGIDPQGNFTFKVEDLSQAEKIIDFNFFIIHKETHKGLYQYYHNSCSLNTLMEKFKKEQKVFQNAVCNQAFEAALDKSGKESLSEKEKATIRKEYETKFNVSMLVRPENIASLLKTFSAIKSFDMTYETIEDDPKTPNPLSQYAARKSERLVFGIKQPGLKKAITSFIKNHSLKSGTIVGTTANGLEQAIKIFNMPDYFQEYEYDELAGYLANVQAARFYEVKILKLLIEAFEEPKNKAIFEAR